MKLLIVDDEELTRVGLISSIDWKSLGIHEIFQADDGIHGLETARIHRPEIILCDVRMPRMDGITMLERLENILPDSVPIFMSGYSDKEYLKAAIKLKAVSYIEKPLNPEEIREAVLEARELYLQKLRSHRGETLHSLETGSRLALLLTSPYGPNSEAIALLTQELALHLTPATYFTAFVIRLDTEPEPSGLSREDSHSALEDFLRHYHLNCLYAERKARYMIYFIFGPSRPSDLAIRSVGDFLSRQYASAGRYYVAAGEPHAGISHAYQSYTSAVILQQSSFFFPCNTILTPTFFEEPVAHPVPLPPTPEETFADALSSRDKNSCDALLGQIYSYCFKNRSVLQNQVKDLYYKLLLVLENTRRQLKMAASFSPEESIADMMENCFAYEDLHKILSEKTEDFFSDCSSSGDENPTIFLIKEYISKNYMNETLSVKDISGHVFLSASYVCTFFKNETGKTLNQYLTEYRMERAKLLLGDHRNRISDISAKVGYSDGNYFGKSFKKYSGYTPSEYREKMMQ